MKKMLLLLAAVLGLTVACCQLNYENTDPEGFAKLIAGPDVVVLDVRTAEEFNEGHIANALNIDVKADDFIKKARATLPKGKTIAVYCRAGRRAVPMLLRDLVRRATRWLICMVALRHGRTTICL